MVEPQQNDKFENAIIDSPKNPTVKKFGTQQKAKVPEVKLQQGEIITKQVSQKFQHCNFEKQLFNIRFDPEDTKLASCYSDGDVFIFNLATGKIESIFDSESKTPTSCLRWKPQQPQSKIKHILLYSNSDGTLYQVHTTSEILVGKQLWKEKEEKNSVLCLDYSSEGNTFATAGRDQIIRLYDDETKTVKQELKGENWQHGGHSNRIFSLKFINDQPDILISGGADKNVFFWDMREKKSFSKIFGPKILGDSLDYKNNQVLACSYSINDNLQIYDFGTQKLIKQFDWIYGNPTISQNVYCAQFVKNTDNCILAGCCGANEVKMFDMESDCCSLFTVTTNESVYSVDSGNLTSKFGFGNSFGSVYVFNLTDKK